MTLLDDLKQEAQISEAISALGENDEELHFCCAAKQLSATKKKRRVALGLTHLALYVFDLDPGPKYLRCMQRIRTIELTGVFVAKGGLVRGLLLFSLSLLPPIAFHRGSSLLSSLLYLQHICLQFTFPNCAFSPDRDAVLHR